VFPLSADAAATRVIYHYEILGDRLVIGKFCRIAPGVTFVMNRANHRMDGFSTYPSTPSGTARRDTP
jgi:virginiamycin A acetyltransferase